MNDKYFTVEWVTNPDGGANSWNPSNVDFTVDVISVPEPAVLSFVVIFGGGILVLKRRFS